MITSISRNFSYITINEVKTALRLSKISIDESHELYKENLAKYYNNKLLYFLKYQMWDEFFYLYKSASVLNHGVNTASHVLAAHGYVMAYQNIDRALEILNSLPKSTSVDLTLNIILCYKELKNQGIPPNSPDWAAVAGICAVAATGRKTETDKWTRLNHSQRAAWHVNLRPWKYPRHHYEIKEEFRFKQRMDK